MYIDALVYFRIVDTHLAVLKYKFADAVELLTQATLQKRNIQDDVRRHFRVVKKLIISFYKK